MLLSRNHNDWCWLSLSFLYVKRQVSTGYFCDIVIQWFHRDPMQSFISRQPEREDAAEP